ncbi:hypothetical protein GCM10023403_33450 [Pseudonocardia benzenivorans]|nr:hypothetical protein PSD17_06880 [Pseudonocardia sp. D17]
MGIAADEVALDVGQDAAFAFVEHEDSGYHGRSDGASGRSRLGADPGITQSVQGM